MDEQFGYSPFDGDVEKTLTDSFNYWTVSKNGDISLKPNGDIFISGKELTSQNWLNHILTKSTIHCGGIPAITEFYSAYILALRNAGIESITISTDPIKVHDITYSK